MLIAPSRVSNTFRTCEKEAPRTQCNIGLTKRPLEIPDFRVITGQLGRTLGSSWAEPLARREEWGMGLRSRTTV